LELVKFVCWCMLLVSQVGSGIPLAPEVRVAQRIAAATRPRIYAHVHEESGAHLEESADHRDGGSDVGSEMEHGRVSTGSHVSTRGPSRTSTAGGSHVPSFLDGLDHRFSSTVDFPRDMDEYVCDRETHPSAQTNLKSTLHFQFHLCSDLCVLCEPILFLLQVLFGGRDHSRRGSRES
jgi:hypothetical protein